MFAGKTRRPGAYPSAGTPLWSRLLALPTNIRLAAKAYHEQILKQGSSGLTRKHYTALLSATGGKAL